MGTPLHFSHVPCSHRTAYVEGAMQVTWQAYECARSCYFSECRQQKHAETARRTTMDRVAIAILFLITATICLTVFHMADGHF
jgi:hypothetical protein